MTIICSQLHKSWFFILYILFSTVYINADFVYPDFNDTFGLVFNGDAKTADCNIDRKYTTVNFPSHTENDINQHTQNSTSQSLGQTQVGLGESRGYQTEYYIETSPKENHAFNKSENIMNGFGHRDSYIHSPKDGCATRLRLTPSHQSKKGSVWYQKKLPVLTGFSTTFQFQISDHSQTCTYHRDPFFSLHHYKSCVVHGGDGFAFVIQLDEFSETETKTETASALSSLGGDGQDLGYGGIQNSLAIEFDTWTNVKEGQNSDDLFTDHISIHASTSLEDNNKIGMAFGYQTALGYSRPANIADGKIHTVKICYYPEIKHEFLGQFTANQNLIPFIKDNGENRRLGTLVVFYDDSDNKEKEKPILAIPINLSVALNLPQSLAYVGFTASTGTKWETHDILNWEWNEIGFVENDESKRNEE